MNDLADKTVQANFLHVEALIARYEVMDLLCKHLNLPRTQRTYASMNDLGWHFAQKLIRQDGKTFWATDTRFPYGGKRRDILRIAGSEFTGTGRARRVNALCCQVVLFLTITNLSALRATGENKKTFVIGRWFQPHSSVIIRDSENRPICPGPLQINHCLWQYARSARARKALQGRNRRPSTEFQRQRQLFGANRVEQLERYERDKHAYFCLLETDSIIGTQNMYPEFIGATSKPDYSRWLQSVTLI